MTFRYDNQFPVNSTSVAGLLTQFSIYEFTYELLSGGIENTSIKVQSRSNEYVLRIYRKNKKSDQEINDELGFMNYLSSSGLPIPVVFHSTDTSYISHVEIDGYNWQAILMECCRGEHPSEYEDKVIESMATIQAKMHIFGAEYMKYQPRQNQWNELKEQWFTHKIDTSVYDDTQLLGFLDRAKSFYARLEDDLPIGYSHFDYFDANLLVNDKGVVSSILDFDDLACGPLVICLGFTLGGLARQSEDTSRLSLYLEFYQKTRPLSVKERDILPTVILFKHYVHSCMNILGGQTSKDKIEAMVNLETKLKGFRLK